MRPSASLCSTILFTLVCVGGLATGATTSSAASGETPEVAARVLAERTVARTAAQPLWSLQALNGNVAWLERARPDALPEVVLRRRDGRLLRRPVPGATQMEIHRGVDRASQRFVTRIVVLVCRDLTCTDARRVLLLPGSLQKSRTEWAPEWDPARRAEGSSRATDGKTVAELFQDPSPRSPAATSTTPEVSLPASDCRIELDGAAVVPVISDCGPAALAVNRTAIVAWMVQPSRTAADFSSVTHRLAILSRAVPERGWSVVGVQTAGRPGSDGVQAWCLQDQGLVVLHGLYRYGPNDRRPPDWVLTLTRPGAATPLATARAPQLTTTGGRIEPYGRIACDGQRLFGISRTITHRAGKPMATTKILQLRFP